MEHFVRDNAQQSDEALVHSLTGVTALCKVHHDHRFAFIFRGRRTSPSPGDADDEGIDVLMPEGNKRLSDAGIHLCIRGEQLFHGTDHTLTEIAPPHSLQ